MGSKYELKSRIRKLCKNKYALHEQVHKFKATEKR